MEDDKNPKYAVLKWHHFEMLKDGNIHPSSIEHYLLKDAEVIRKQDMTSGPVLHLYSNLILAYRDLVPMSAEQSDHLLDVADHFHNAGYDADTERAANRAKLPD